MRKLYLFVNGQSMRDWLSCLSLTDDGVILGNHICSHMGYMMHDLHDRSDRLEKIKQHFNGEPYEVIVLSYQDCNMHEEFKKALALAKEKQQTFEKAGATAVISDNDGKEHTITL